MVISFLNDMIRNHLNRNVKRRKLRRSKLEIAIELLFRFLSLVFLTISFSISKDPEVLKFFSDVFWKSAPIISTVIDFFNKNKIS